MRKSSSSSLLMLSQIHCTSLLDARKKEEQSINQYVSNQSGGVTIITFVRTTELPGLLSP